jgi:hypothetical protein
LSSQCLSRLKHLLRPRANAEIFGEIAPAHDSIAVDQEFGGAGDVVSARTLALMHKVISPNGPGVRIRQEGIRVAGFLRQIARLPGRIDADGNRLDARCAEFGEMIFNTP